MGVENTHVSWKVPPTQTTHISKPQISIQEILEKARTKSQASFKVEDLVNELARLGLSQDEAESLVEHLKDSSEIGMDDVGLWHWIS